MNTRTILATLAAASLTLLLVVPAATHDATATHSPANKVSAVGSTVEVAGPGETLTILAGSMRTSSPTDLILQVTLECSILTQVTTVGNDDQQAFGRIEVWVEIDGEPVGVTAGDDGRVVFCDRAHRQTTSLFDDDDATIESYLKTRTANAFNWVALNTGSGVHTLEVKAHFTEEATDNAVAQAVIGKRTFVAEPTKLANDATV